MSTHSAFKKLLPFWAFAFFFKCAGALHYTLLPILGERVFPIWVTGLLIAGTALIQLTLDVPAGYLLDRFGYVRLLRIGTLFFIAANVLLFFGLTPVTFILTLAFQLVGWLFFGPGVDAYILTKAESHIAGAYMSTRDMAESAGVVIGMGLLAFVAQLPVPLIGAIVCIPFSLSLIALGGAPRDAASVHAEQKIAYQSYYIRRTFLHRLFASIKKFNPASSLLVLTSFSSATFYGIIWFVVPLLIAHSIQAQTLSIGLMVFDFAIVITGFFIGKLVDAQKSRRLIFWGLLLFSVCAVLLGFHLGILFIILGFLATTGDEMSSVSLWAWLDHLDKKHREDAVLTGTINFFQDAGWMVGPAIAGLIYGHVGAAWTIAAGGGILFLTWLVSTLHLSGPGSTPKPALEKLQFLTHIPKRKRHKR